MFTNRWPPQKNGAVSFTRVLGSVHSYSKCNTTPDRNGDLAIPYGFTLLQEKEAYAAVPPDHRCRKIQPRSAAAARPAPRGDRPPPGRGGDVYRGAELVARGWMRAERRRSRRVFQALASPALRDQGAASATTTLAAAASSHGQRK